MFEQTTTDGIGRFAKSANETELNAKLATLRSGNWQALRDMPRCDLDGLANEIAKVHHIGNFVSDVSALRSDAVQAIRAEQIKRDNEQAERFRMQQRRRASITRATSLLAEASELIEMAASIPDESPAPPKLPTVDIASATDDELIQVRGECAGIVDASRVDVFAKQVEAIALLESQASKQICTELRKKGKTDADRTSAARELIDRINTELENREQTRIAKEEAASPESLIARIEALEARL